VHLAILDHQFVYMPKTEMIILLELMQDENFRSMPKIDESHTMFFDKFN
jgi:hypothetical protein